MSKNSYRKQDMVKRQSNQQSKVDDGSEIPDQCLKQTVIDVFSSQAEETDKNATTNEELN